MSALCMLDETRHCLCICTVYTHNIDKSISAKSAKGHSLFLQYTNKSLKGILCIKLDQN